MLRPIRFGDYAVNSATGQKYYITNMDPSTLDITIHNHSTVLRNTDGVYYDNNGVIFTFTPNVPSRYLQRNWQGTRISIQPLPVTLSSQLYPIGKSLILSLWPDKITVIDISTKETVLEHAIDNPKYIVPDANGNIIIFYGKQNVLSFCDLNSKSLHFLPNVNVSAGIKDIISAGGDDILVNIHEIKYPLPYKREEIIIVNIYTQNIISSHRTNSPMCQLRGSNHTEKIIAFTTNDLHDPNILSFHPYGDGFVWVDSVMELLDAHGKSNRVIGRTYHRDGTPDSTNIYSIENANVPAHIGKSNVIASFQDTSTWDKVDMRQLQDGFFMIYGFKLDHTIIHIWLDRDDYSDVVYTISLNKKYGRVHTIIQLTDGNLLFVNDDGCYIIKVPLTDEESIRENMQNILLPAMRLTPNPLFKGLDPLMFTTEMSQYYPRSLSQ